MQFENLPNDIILDVFDHLDFIDLLYGFYDLNNRFYSLIFFHQTDYCLDLRRIAKNIFDQICSSRLSCVADRVKSLHLSDKDETPKQVTLFLNHGLTVDLFFNLHSLHLYGILTFDLLDQLLVQCVQLPSLTILEQIECDWKYSEVQCRNLLNSIWKLRNLRILVFRQTVSRQINFSTLDFCSLTIKSLTLDRVSCDLKQFYHLLNRTPTLDYFYMDSAFDLRSYLYMDTFHSMISLTLICNGTENLLMDLLERFPNLQHLCLRTKQVMYDGNQWKQTICRCFPNLQRFHLTMELNFYNSSLVVHQVDQLIKTFRTPFWIEEHRWFVRCDWDPLNMFNIGILYTLPYKFNDCFYFDATASISTCPEINDGWTYQGVKTLSHENPENDLEKDPIFFSSRFTNLQHLIISFPFDERFWSCLSSLDRLTSIHIKWLYDDIGLIQCRKILSSAKHLRSLIFSSYNHFPAKFLCFDINSSIRYLDLIGDFQQIQYFDDTECEILMQSPIISQCEHISIAFKYRDDIVHWIKNLTRLRSLVFAYRSDEFEQWSFSPADDQFIQWLQKQLSSAHSISRHPRKSNLIRLWISKNEEDFRQQSSD